MDLLEIFKDSGDFERFTSGTEIISEGEEGHLMYVVMEGEVSISLKTTVIAVAKPGEIVGEMALINSDIRSATVTATTDCLLAVIDESSFKSLLKYVPDFTLHIMGVLAERLQNAYEMIET